VVDAVADIDIKMPRFSEEGFVLGGAAPVAVAGGLRLRVGLGFHNQTPQELTCGLALHEQTTDQLRSDNLSGPGEEGWRERWGGDEKLKRLWRQT
jgi:hypothetical protein